MPPAISVVICAYTEERWNDLVAAVESVRRQTVRPLQIVVVVDHNPPMLERVRRDILDVVAVENRESRGLSGARNSGIAVSRGEVVAFLDDDAIADDDWLESLARGYVDADVIGVGGAVEPLWAGPEPSSFPDEFLWVVGCTYRGMPDHAAPVRNAIGANMSFRRDVFAAVGGFRTGIGRIGTRPVGCEETEFSIRARQHGRASIVLHEPRARVRHRVPAARTTWTYFLSRCYSEGLSKALVAQVAGSRDGLSSERAYALKTLPSGVVRGLRDALVGGDSTGLGRAARIMAGFAVTASGYAVGRLRTPEASLGSLGTAGPGTVARSINA